MKDMDKHALLKSYCQPDEKLLLAKVLDQADLSLKKNIISYTDFLSPAMCSKVCCMLSSVRDLKYIAFGGYEDAERKMIALCPDYIMDEDIIFPIKAVKISYNNKFTAELSHRDFLGSIIAVGIERSKIGDIVVNESLAYCFAKESISSYIAQNLEKTGRTKVKAEVVEIGCVDIKEKKMDIKNITVSSMRADTVFGAVFKKSRSEAQKLIRGEKAFVNWNTVKSVSDTVKEGDVLNLKGSGRVKILEAGSTTKKGRLVLKFGIYI